LITVSFQTASEGSLYATQVYPTSFRFIRDVYSPYTELTAKYLPLNTPFTNANRIRLILGNTMVHDGIVDKINLYRPADDNYCVVRSRGYSSLLLQNEITPGLHTNLTFNNLMDNFITIPTISHESNSSGTNYIYVKQGSSMWEAISNFCYKVYGTHPYISGANVINVTQKTNPATFTRTTSDCFAWGQKYDFTNAVSHFHMADIDGNHNAYNYTDSAVTAKQIIRHKHYELDRQYLEDPQNSLLYRSKMSKRRFYSVYYAYDDYNGETLGDIMNLSGTVAAANRRINRVEIIGTSSKSGYQITTKVFAYTDGFFP
jgi:hypothetical protein